MSRIVRYFAAFALTLVATEATAQSSIEYFPFTLDRDNVPFGREIMLSFSYRCRPNFDVADVEDDGAGQLAFTVAPPLIPSVLICFPPVIDRSVNLKSHFELAPGDYSLTVRQAEGDQQFEFTVRDSVLDAGPAQTGYWFDPAQSGHGLNFEFLPDHRVLATWYAYDDDGENRWLIGTGTYDGDRAELEVFRTSGRGFPPDYDPNSHELEPWGGMTFVLQRCDAGTLSWTTTDEDFGDGEMPLARLSPPNGLPCLDDQRESDAWNTVNLLADDPELDFDLLNASADGSGGETSWTVAFEDLPSELGEGRALTARPGAADRTEAFFLGMDLLGKGRTEFRNTRARPPYVTQAELTVALPGEVACDQSTELFVAVSFMEYPWNPASEEYQQPLIFSPFGFGDEAVGQLFSGISHLRQDDCSTVDDYLVRTFVTPAVRSPSQWAVLAVHLDRWVNPSKGVEGPVYLLDFRVRARELTR